jgi:hypothetical protein
MICGSSPFGHFHWSPIFFETSYRGCFRSAGTPAPRHLATQAFRICLFQARTVSRLTSEAWTDAHGRLQLRRVGLPLRKIPVGTKLTKSIPRCFAHSFDCLVQGVIEVRGFAIMMRCIADGPSRTATEFRRTLAARHRAGFWSHPVLAREGANSFQEANLRQSFHSHGRSR